MIFQTDDKLHESLAGINRRARTLWVDGHAKDLSALTEFTDLDTLSLYRLPKRHVPLITDLKLPKLKSLAIRHLDAPDLQVVAAYPTLQELTVWQSKKVTSLKGVERLERLDTLALMDLGPIDSLAPIAQLGTLKHLELKGGIWSTQGLPSLAPLEALVKLEILDLGGAKVQNNDLRPITKLGKLRELGLSARNFAPEEIALVAAAHDFWLKNLLDLQDFDDWKGAQGCSTCGGRRKILFLRKRKMLWCPRCEEQALDKHLRRFRGLVERKRAEL